MSTKINKLDTDFGKCRCCQGYGFLKNMWSSYNYKGETEVYGEMIKQCFGITCSPIEEPGVGDRICDQCIFHLRNAFGFKKIIIESQNKLGFKNEDDMDTDHGWEQEDDGVSQYLTVHFDQNDEKLDPEASDGADDDKDFKDVEYLEDEMCDINPPKCMPPLKQKPRSRSDKLHDNRIILTKFKKNVVTILDNSNASVIRGHRGIGYTCFYCPQQQQKPVDLKKHTLEEHSDVKNDVTKVKSVMDIYVKLDITGLCCKLCGDNMKCLDEFTRHLPFHDIKYYPSTKNFIVPFRFDTEELKCAHCAKEFHNFKYLSEHMVEHYRNYECNECARGFINERSLRIHKVRHKKGTFMCSYCSKIFDTEIKMKEHERNFHIKKNLTNKCGYCDERFYGLLRKTKHEVEVHGVQLPVSQCNVCNKICSSRQTLKAHIHHVHSLVRPYSCEECGKSFTGNYMLRLHLETHTGKNYQCDACTKRYATKKSLRKHLLKVHEKGKTYSCEECGEMFFRRSFFDLHKRDKH